MDGPKFEADSCAEEAKPEGKATVSERSEGAGAAEAVKVNLLDPKSSGFETSEGVAADAEVNEKVNGFAGLGMMAVSRLEFAAGVDGASLGV